MPVEIKERHIEETVIVTHPKVEEPEFNDFNIPYYIWHMSVKQARRLQRDLNAVLKGVDTDDS